MQSLFSNQLNIELKETNFLEFLPSAHRSMAWSSMRPYETPAMREYLAPYLGEAFMAEIVTYANLPDSDQDVAILSSCLNRVRLALAYYMGYNFTVDQNVQLSDLGPQTQSASEGGSSQPSQWAFKNKVWNLISKADQYTDQLLNFLEGRARAQDASFETWSNDPLRRRQTSDFFTSTTEVDNYLNIEGNLRAWNNMVPSFRTAEWRHLLPVLGSAFNTELVGMYKTGVNITPTHQTVIVLVQRVVAHYGLLLAIPNLSCVIQGNGIVMVSQMDGFDERVSSSLTTEQTAITRLQQSHEGLGRIALAELRNYIIRNADNLPTYKNSPAFISAPDPVLPIGDKDGGAIFL